MPDENANSHLDTKLSDYKVEIHVQNIDTNQTISLSAGVNVPALSSGKYDAPQQSSLLADYTTLYHAAGIRSIRTHESCLDVANIFRGPSIADSMDWLQSASVEFSVSASPTIIANYFNGSDALFREIVERAVADRLQTSPYDQQAYNYAQKAFLQSQAGLLFNHIDFAKYCIYRGINLANNNNKFYLGDVWLYWRPALGVDLDSPDSYNWSDSMAEQLYKSMLDEDFEIYYRLGDAYHGPSYMGPDGTGFDSSDNRAGKMRYARVAANVVSQFSQIQGDLASPAPPRFVEFWNEPDSGHFTGPDDQIIDVPDAAKLDKWSSDLTELYEWCFDELTALGIDPATIGGLAFTAKGMRHFLSQCEQNTNLSKVHAVLSKMDPSKLHFLSFHLYGNLELQKFGVRPITLTFEFASSLRDICSYLHQLAGFSDLKIHLSEWHLTSLQAPGYEGITLSPFGGAFASAALSWMQYPELNIERAHMYPGYSTLSGHFSFESAENIVPHFTVRPSALASFFHSETVDDYWVPLTIHKSTNLTWQEIGDVFECVDQSEPIVALSSKSAEHPGRVSVILTNLGRRAADITVSIEGLSPGQYNATTVVSQWEDGIQSVPAAIDVSNGYVVPDPTSVQTLFEELSTPSTEDTVSVDIGGTFGKKVTVPGPGIARLEIEFVSLGEGDITGFSNMPGKPDASIWIPDEKRVAPEYFYEKARYIASWKDLLNTSVHYGECLRVYRSHLSAFSRFMEEAGYELKPKDFRWFWNDFITTVQEDGCVCENYSEELWLTKYIAREK